MFYFNFPLLHCLPKFVPKTKNILVGNGQYVCVLIVIPVVINIQGYSFEEYTLIKGIHNKVDMIMGIKNVCIIGVISTRDFLNGSIPFFPKTEMLLKSKEHR